MAALTKAGLKLLVTASLENAKSLIDEAELLLNHSHISRAYFLAVAAIEEIGKAIIAFEGQGRNLSDGAVQSKLFKTIIDHKSKIISAFVGSLKTTEPKNMEEAIETSIGLMSGLRAGREPSMYTELLPNGTVQSPAAIVRQIAAADAIRLAKHCYARAEKYLSSTAPETRSHSDNFVYIMNKNVHAAILGSSDFWWYHISQIKSGSSEMSDNILYYHTDFYSKNRMFKY